MLTKWLDAFAVHLVLADEMTDMWLRSTRTWKSKTWAESNAERKRTGWRSRTSTKSSSNSIFIIESHESSLPKDIASDKEEEAGDQVRAPQIHRAWAIADARSEIRHYPSSFHFNCELLRCHSQDAQQKGVSDSTEIQTPNRVGLRSWAILD